MEHNLPAFLWVSKLHKKHLAACSSSAFCSLRSFRAVLRACRFDGGVLAKGLGGGEGLGAVVGGGGRGCEDR